MNPIEDEAVVAQVNSLLSFSVSLILLDAD